MGQSKITVKQLLFFVIILTSLGKSYSQIVCGSELNLPLIQQNNPARYSRILALEQHTQNYINSVSNDNNAARLINANATIIIPVVVHVLHRGEAIGVGRNISDLQIESQIDVLNEDFRRLNADAVNTPVAFQGVAADANFEFRLACIDPNGNPTNGITRSFAGDDQFNPLGNINPLDGSFNEQAIGIKFTNSGGIDAWPTSRYLNIWVCDMSGGLIGYGQFPDEYSVKPNTDGVVMLFNAFGRVGNLLPGLNQGRVCVHEIGHWLNLRHIWGDANCGNDFVDDTPTQGFPNGGCPVFPHVTCNNGPSGDMFMNYMDYTDNGCMNIYTTGQSLRMRAVFAQGGPRADFIDNYFGINTPNDPICTSGTITANNPNCLPVTWEVVSGPATITNGQGTSTVTIERSGNPFGNILLKATAGGYTDEKNFIVGFPPFIGPTGADTAWPNSNYYYYAHLPLGYPPVSDYYWEVPSGWTILSGQGTNTLYVRTGTAGGAVEVDVTACGITRPVYKYVEIGSGSWWPDGGGGDVYMRQSTRLSPNPADNFVTISMGNHNSIKTGKEANTFFSAVTIYDITGAVKKRLRYPAGTRQTRLNTSDLGTGTYIVEITDGRQVERQQLVIQR